MNCKCNVIFCVRNKKIKIKNKKKVRSLLHEVKTDKNKSRSVEKQAGFKLHVTLVCYY